MNAQRLHLAARCAGFAVVLVVAAMLAGCVTTTPPTAVHQPMTVRPEPRPQYQTNAGAIFQPGAVRPLFEDRRARMVGDTLVINLSERTQAAKKSSSSADRSQDIEVSVPRIAGVPLKGAQGIGVQANSENVFAGKGASSADNNFTGTITVTVIEVLPNGNLLVSGEKKVAINQGDEYIRFSGVVNPTQVTAANTVQSTQVADARIEYRATGYIDEAQVMGWLGRFFLSFLPL
ncbi:MAG: flagellar basal body L-ring protein FlgH [Methyloversatilis sp.]|jgi:flagellar L-ring protein FlgH|uniref:flagellar basal body L-ring protein FlgH n=1 Tax=Methyloversatilis TaxID=378210 RepID=UPI000DB397C4|nr:flagellar basal body L-ring protein FlgH [Methyloversatilis discipulorum]MBC7208303.1 flagellar basal body L-ring protein FlgH [Methyloversatilis sp.]MBT9516383.1 flagellar basal body L-ring protein FlgH [Methyloversatilis discipulorum]PZU52343.1 MAG: flagellar biosynthesis protein FlgH [Thauera sp.]